MSRFAFHDVLGKIVAIVTQEVTEETPAPRATDHEYAAAVALVSDNVDPETHYFKIDATRNHWTLERRPILPVTVVGDTVTVPPNCTVWFAPLDHPISTGDKVDDIQIDLKAGEELEVSVTKWPYRDVLVTVSKPLPGVHGKQPPEHDYTITEH